MVDIPRSLEVGSVPVSVRSLPVCFLNYSTHRRIPSLDESKEKRYEKTNHLLESSWSPSETR